LYAQLQKTCLFSSTDICCRRRETGRGMGNYSNLASQFGIDIGGSVVGGVFKGQNLLSFMVSRSMIEKTLLTTVDIKCKKTLTEFYIDINQLREKWIKANSSYKNVRFLPGSNPSTFTLDQNSVMGSIYGDLTAKYLVVGVQNKRSSFLSVKVTSKNE
jgi:hypothetical protein